jgi:hypothetical protein
MRVAPGLLALFFSVGCGPMTMEPRDLGHMAPPPPPDMSAGIAPQDDMAKGTITPPSPDLSAEISSDMAAPQQGPTPLVVDDSFAASGYEGGGNPQGTITDDQSCPMRRGDGRGKCHHVQWTPGTSSWGGVVWQSPAGNWGSAPGLAIPGGYAQVRFWAWGKSGGEAVSFLTGLGAGGPDKFQQRLDVTLTAQPKLYILGVRGAYGDKVVSAFGWVTGSAAATTFYIDDIVWTGDAEGDGSAPTSFGVDTKFGPSGYMGDGSRPGFVSHGDCVSPNGDTLCHHFEWDPNCDAGGTTQGWAGVFWQSASGDWAGASDPAGAAVGAGYREVRFWAWSSGAGGEDVSFLAGMGANTKDGWQSKLEVHLNATPTLYTMGVAGGYGSNVVGGFGWVTGNAGGLGFNIDGAIWR